MINDDKCKVLSAKGKRGGRTREGRCEKVELCAFDWMNEGICLNWQIQSLTYRLDGLLSRWAADKRQPQTADYNIHRPCDHLTSAFLTPPSTSTSSVYPLLPFLLSYFNHWIVCSQIPVNPPYSSLHFFRFHMPKLIRSLCDSVSVSIQYIPLLFFRIQHQADSVSVSVFSLQPSHPLASEYTPSK